jgi:hypothetical protein
MPRENHQVHPFQSFSGGGAEKNHNVALAVQLLIACVLPCSGLCCSWLYTLRYCSLADFVGPCMQRELGCEADVWAACKCSDK